MKNRKKMFIILVIVGVGLLVSGVIVELLTGESRYLGFAMGFGVAITLVAAGNLILMRRRPELAKEEEINEKDERFIQIRGRAAQTTYYISLFGMLAAAMVFLFLNDITACFVVIGLMLLHTVSYFALLGHYSKKM